MLYHRSCMGFSFLSLITDYNNSIIKTKGPADDMREGLVLAGNFLLSELAGMTKFTAKIIARGSMEEVYICGTKIHIVLQFTEGLVGCLFSLFGNVERSLEFI